MTSIVEVYRRWPTKDTCIAHLEAVRWDGHPLCPYCGAVAVSRNRDAKRGLTASRWKCQRCMRSFSVTVGTIFHNSHIDLRLWFLLLSLMLSAKKGLSVMQAARDLETRRPTVWSMLKTIRQAPRDQHALATLLVGEEWQAVVGFEGLYEVSNLGEIRSLRASKIKSPQANPRGYLHVGLYDRGGKNVYIHRAVLEGFVGAPRSDQEGCHWNGDRSDNALLNLRWDTSKANHADRLVHGTHGRGERNATAKLSEMDVIAIRAAVAGGAVQTALAAQYGVSKHAVNDIVHGRTWAALGAGR